MRTVFSVALSFLFASAALGQAVDFQDVSLPGPESAYYGADNAGGFVSRGVGFNNSYVDFGGGFFAWSGFSYSNVTDVTTPGFGNQFSAYHLPGGGGDGSSQYGVGFAFFRGEAVLDLAANVRPNSVRLTNTTYAALSMRDGDSFAKKFGGPTGLDPDFFSVTFHGDDGNGGSTGDVTFFLADFRPAGTANDRIVDAWTTVDLSPLGENTRRIELEFASTDIGPFGINTPTFVALDNLTLAEIPEPAAIVLLGAAGLGATLRHRSRGKRRTRKARQARSAPGRGPRCGERGTAV